MARGGGNNGNFVRGVAASHKGPNNFRGRGRGGSGSSSGFRGRGRGQWRGRGRGRGGHTGTAGDAVTLQTEDATEREDLLEQEIARDEIDEQLGFGRYSEGERCSEIACMSAHLLSRKQVRPRLAGS